MIFYGHKLLYTTIHTTFAKLLTLHVEQRGGITLDEGKMITHKNVLAVEFMFLNEIIL